MNDAIHAKVEGYFSQFPLKKYAKSEIITLANQEPEGVMYLVEGIVEQYDITPQGNKTVVNVYKPPAFFPMSWAINAVPNSYFFGAVSQVGMHIAPRDAALQFIKQNPDVAFDLLSRVYRGTDAILRRLVIAAEGIASRRLIFELIIEAYRFGALDDNNDVTFSIKQSVLAARSGLARETVSREMRKLQLNGLIVRKNQSITTNLRCLETLLEITV